MSELRFFCSAIPAPGGSKSAFPIYKKRGLQPNLGKGWRPSMAEPCGNCGFTGRVAVSDAAGNKNLVWRQEIAAAAIRAMKDADLAPWDCALELELIFHLPRPKSHFLRKNVIQLRAGAPMFPITRPDVGKLARSTQDALTGIVWRDDAQVVTETHEKVYSDQSGCWIVIREAGR